MPWHAAPITLLVLLTALGVNSKIVGFLPDDPPRGHRRTHPRPTPMVGGLLGAGIAGYLFAVGTYWLATAVTIAWLVGLYDDIGKQGGRDVGWQGKAVGLVVAAVCATIHIDPSLDLSGRDLYLLFLFIFVLTNAFNFLDNTDGVSASLGALALLLVGSQGALAPVPFIYLGFLILNWPRPLIFLGDSGALVLGICAATAAGGALPDWGATVASVAIPLSDFFQVMIARLMIGVPPWIGDRRHLTHIAMNMGVPRVLVAPLLAGLGYVFFWTITQS